MIRRRCFTMKKWGVGAAAASDLLPGEMRHFRGASGKWARLRSHHIHPEVIGRREKPVASVPAMSRTLTMLLLTAGIAVAGAATASAASADKPPVVVELFTSQGCSSCPPADALLGKLAQRPDVVALAFHVDYWDYIGWKDPYASPAFTQRQHRYADALGLHMVYTPQMVVDGHVDVAGSHALELEAAIADARAQQKLTLTLGHDANGAYDVKISGAASGGPSGPATVWLALLDRQRETPVKRGENAGATLTDYNIVREFRQIGTWTGAALDLPLGVDPAAMQGRGCAVIVQNDPMGAVLGATILSMADGL